MSHYYPIMLKIKGKPCTVVGGGLVAERKVHALLEHGAAVTVIGPTLTEGLQRLLEEKQILHKNKHYETGDLAGSCLVYAATDDADVNRKCKEEGEAQYAFVNVVDSPEASDFILPAIVKRGSLTITVSTEGKSPALSQKIKKELEAKYKEEYGGLVDTLGEIREKALGEIPAIEDRKKLFHQLAKNFIEKAPFEGEVNGLKENMWEEYYKFILKKA